MSTNQLLSTPLNQSDDDIPETDYNKLSNDELAASEKERLRFTKHSALVTLLIMSIGPLSLIVQAVGETLDMLMITKRFKGDSNSHAVEIIGFSNLVGSLIGYIGMYFSQCLTTRISNLIGAGQRQSAAHLVSDIFYLTVLSTLVIGSLFVFVIKPFLRFVGTPESMMSETFKYCIVTVAVSPIGNIGTFLLGYLQSIGSSILSGGWKVLIYAVQLGIFTPLCLFAFKVSTTFMKLGSFFASLTVGGILLFLVYKGKFSLKPHLSDVFGGFSSETPKALLSAAPLIIAFFVFILPPTLILQTLTSVDKEHSSEIAGVFAVFNQLGVINQAIPGAFGQGYLSAGTHAMGSNDPRRLLRLFFWALLFTSSLCLLLSLVVVPGKEAIAKVFLEGQSEIELAKRMLPVPFYTSPLQGIGIVISMTLIIIGKPGLAFIPMSLQMIILMGGCKIIAHYSKDDPVKVMYIYNISDITVFIVYMFLMIVPIKVLRKKIRENGSTSASLYEGNNELNVVKSNL